MCLRKRPLAGRCCLSRDNARCAARGGPRQEYGTGCALAPARKTRKGVGHDSEMIRSRVGRRGRWLTWHPSCALAIVLHSTLFCRFCRFNSSRGRMALRHCSPFSKGGPCVVGIGRFGASTQTQDRGHLGCGSGCESVHMHFVPGRDSESLVMFALVLPRVVQCRGAYH